MPYFFDEFTIHRARIADAHKDKYGIVEAKDFWAEGNYLTHNWTKDPKGKGILDDIKVYNSSGTEQSDLQNRLGDWRELFERTLDQYQGAGLKQRIREARAELKRIRRPSAGEQGLGSQLLFQIDTQNQRAEFQ